MRKVGICLLRPELEKWIDHVKDQCGVELEFCPPSFLRIKRSFASFSEAQPYVQKIERALPGFISPGGGELPLYFWLTEEDEPLSSQEYIIFLEIQRADPSLDFEATHPMSGSFDIDR